MCHVFPTCSGVNRQHHNRLVYPQLRVVQVMWCSMQTTVALWAWLRTTSFTKSDARQMTNWLNQQTTALPYFWLNSVLLFKRRGAYNPSIQQANFLAA
jgi:hypothetical protein